MPVPTPISTLYEQLPPRQITDAIFVNYQDKLLFDPLVELVRQSKYLPRESCTPENLAAIQKLRDALDHASTLIGPLNDTPAMSRKYQKLWLWENALTTLLLENPPRRQPRYDSMMAGVDDAIVKIQTNHYRKQQLNLMLRMFADYKTSYINDFAWVTEESITSKINAALEQCELTSDLHSIDLLLSAFNLAYAHGFLHNFYLKLCSGGASLKGIMDWFENMIEHTNNNIFQLDERDLYDNLYLFLVANNSLSAENFFAVLKLYQALQKKDLFLNFDDIERLKSELEDQFKMPASNEDSLDLAEFVQKHLAIESGSGPILVVEGENDHKDFNHFKHLVDLANNFLKAPTVSYFDALMKTTASNDIAEKAALALTLFFQYPIEWYIKGPNGNLFPPTEISRYFSFLTPADYINFSVRDLGRFFPGAESVIYYLFQYITRFSPIVETAPATLRDVFRVPPEMNPYWLAWDPNNIARFLKVQRKPLAVLLTTDQVAHILSFTPKHQRDVVLKSLMPHPYAIVYAIQSDRLGLVQQALLAFAQESYWSLLEVELVQRLPADIFVLALARAKAPVLNAVRIDIPTETTSLLSSINSTGVLITLNNLLAATLDLSNQAAARKNNLDLFYKYLDIFVQWFTGLLGAFLFIYIMVMTTINFIADPQMDVGVNFILPTIAAIVGVMSIPSLYFYTLKPALVAFFDARPIVGFGNIEKLTKAIIAELQQLDTDNTVLALIDEIVQKYKVQRGSYNLDSVISHLLEVFLKFLVEHSTVQDLIPASAENPHIQPKYFLPPNPETPKNNRCFT